MELHPVMDVERVRSGLAWWAACKRRPKHAMFFVKAVVIPSALDRGNAGAAAQGPCDLGLQKGLTKMTSDSQLQSDVQAELQWQPSVDAAHIGVAAKDHIITLTGQVVHFAEKAAAEKAAKGVYGVQAVANDIVVELLDSSRRTDQDIAQAAVSAMHWDFEVPADQIKVIVKNGWVTLEGKVDWQYQKDAAKRCVQYLMGVTAVTNAVTIKPTVKWIDVKNKIEEAFRRNAELDARRIGVATYNGMVTLNGSVSSWAERDEAVTAAWGSPGVTSVNDKLTVVV